MKDQFVDIANDKPNVRSKELMLMFFCLTKEKLQVDRDIALVEFKNFDAVVESLRITHLLDD